MTASRRVPIKADRDEEQDPPPGGGSGGSASATVGFRARGQSERLRTQRHRSGGPISRFCREHYTHFNAGTLVRAADAWRELIDQGGTMFVTLAGAMSTGEIGKSLAEMIRQGKVGAISCTGANLEESVFNLVGRHEYLPLPNYRDLTPKDEKQIADENWNRVTDTAIPDEEVVKPVTDAMMAYWKAADAAGEHHFPHEYLYDVLRNGDLKAHYEDDPANCWLLAAAEKNLPIVVPGWEDSTLGNAFASALLRGDLKDPSIMCTGIDYFIALAGWYAAMSADNIPVGFFQIGGGIAGDFPICVVPALKLELERDDTPSWAYFCQIGDSHESYGGYSGASPTEKITWRKLEPETPMFEIHSDASIVAPAIFALVLGW